MFFKVHINVKHFDTTVDELKDIWEKNAQAVKEAFNFIAEHQIQLWEDLTLAMKEYNKEWFFIYMCKSFSIFKENIPFLHDDQDFW